MKKNFWKKALSMMLTTMVVLSLCACGGNDDTPGGSDSSGGGGGGLFGGGGNKKTDPNAALAKEYVYDYQEIVMPDMEDVDNFNISGSTVKDGILYMILYTYNWTTGNGEQVVSLFSMKEDGTDAKMVKLQMPGKEEEAGDAEGNVGGGAGTFPMPRTEGIVVETSAPAVNASVDNDMSVDGDFAVDSEIAVDPNYNPNVYENTYYGNYKFGADGNIYATKNYYYEDYSDPENYIYIQKTYVCSWDLNGKYLWETEVEGLQSDEEWLYVGNMSIAPDGTVNVLLTGDNVYKLQVKDGVASARKPLADDVTKIFYNHSNIIPKADGTLLVIYYDENDWAKTYLTTYDPVTDTVGASAEMPQSFSYSGYYAINAGVSKDLIFATGDGVYTLNIGDTASTKKMDYINSDVAISYMENIVEVDDKTFLGIYYDMFDNELRVGKFTYVDPATIPDKSVMVLAGTYINNNMKKRVVDFNRDSDNYRIVLKEYNSYNTYEDYQAGNTKLNNDIITGNMPDILIAENLPIENYISKGLLVDIGEKIANDPELSKVEFVQKVFDAYSVKGKLYQVIPSYTVTTMIGKSSILGDKTTWTMAEMQEIAKGLPEGTEMFSELTRSYFMNLVMQFCAGDFVDVETGKCDFNSHNFIEMMEYAKSLPEQLDEDYYNQFWETYESRFRDNRTILSMLSIGYFQGLNYNINGNYGEDVAYIGFPTQSGQGSYVNAETSYAISSRSKHVDAAWEFVRYYLTDEYQVESVNWGIPIQVKYLKERAQEATKRPYYEDENGNKVEYDDYYYINGEQILLPPMSQEQVDELVTFVQSVDKRYYNNTEIINIVNEEIESYFTGQKTADAVAAIIQSRAQIYVDENR